MEHDAFVARTTPTAARYRPSPIPRPGVPTLGAKQQSFSALVQQRTWSLNPWQPPRNPLPAVTPDVYRNLPWSAAPWQPSTATSDPFPQEPRICHTCGIPGHTHRRCWQEHPELHPANPMWVCQQLALFNQSSPNPVPTQTSDIKTGAPPALTQ